MKLVEEMLGTKQKLQTVVLEKNITYHEQKCNRLDAEIDQLVYKLYDLTEEEIEIVEGEK